MLERVLGIIENWLFGPQSQGVGPLALARRVLRYPYAVLRDLMHGDLNLRAMGLVFATLLSIVPLLALSLAVLKGFDAHRALEPIIHEFFRPIGAGADAITARIMQFADNVSGGLLGSVGLALLLWTLIGTIKKIEDSFNFVWHVEQPRSFARRIAEYAALLVIGPLLLVAFLGLTHRALASEPWQVLSSLPLLDRITTFATQLGPYLMVTGLFTLMYMFVPNTRVRILPAVIGGVTAGVLWAAVGKLFTALVIYTTRLTIVYAGFAIIVATLLWTYFGWLILLVGAQLSFYVQHPNYLRIGLGQLRLSNVEHERLVLRIMFLVGKAHAEGLNNWSIATLATKLGLPGITVADAVRSLESARLLTTSEQECLLPSRDIGHIRIEQIVEVARQSSQGHVRGSGISLPAVDRITSRIDAAWRECCGDRTLRDLVEEEAAA